MLRQIGFGLLQRLASAIADVDVQAVVVAKVAKAIVVVAEVVVVIVVMKDCCKGLD